MQSHRGTERPSDRLGRLSQHELRIAIRVDGDHRAVGERARRLPVGRGLLKTRPSSGNTAEFCVCRTSTESTGLGYAPGWDNPAMRSPMESARSFIARIRGPCCLPNETGIF